MASKFNLTAQLSLAAPTNVAQIVRQVNSQLQGVQMKINPVVNAKSLNQANTAVQKVGVSAKVTSKNLNGAAGSAHSLGSALGAAARRFASITIATGFFLALTRAIGSAVGRAIEFEREMLKISQVTGKSIRGLRDLSVEVTRLSTNLGVSSEELLNAARTLSQAGFAAEKVTGALKILAQTDLAATFDNIKDTTEGAIAILSQFRAEVRAAGGEVQFLEKAMDAINSVSKNFAVESADLISVVRRTGGVFEAAGGKLNELIALFTSVRATTRETADTIATGFRTIFTRIQRSETIDSLKELGIVLQDTEGKFVGPMEAIARLSAGLKALDPRDFRFNEIVEQLGGFRQIGKVIPLIKQYATSTEALAVANNSLGSTAQDAAIAQQGLGNQFAQLKEKFDATIRSIASSETFQTLATSAIKLAEAILSIVESLEPLLPMLTALAAFKLGSIAMPAMGRFAGVGGRHEGGKVHGFAGGGMVPGRGNRDTVPAMLQPGEFVMRKSAVKKIGSNNMADMNNGYAAGGTVTARRSNYGQNAPGQAPGFNQAGLVGSGTGTKGKSAPAQASKLAAVQAALKKATTTYEVTKTGLRPGGFSLDKSSKQTKGVTTSRGLGISGQVPLSWLDATGFSKVEAQLMAKTGATPGDVVAARNTGASTKAILLPSEYPIGSIVDSGVRTQVEGDLQGAASKGLEASVIDTVNRVRKNKAVGQTITKMGLSMAPGDAKRAGAQTGKDEQAVSSMVGFLFEGVIDAMSGAKPAGERASFDIPKESMTSARSNLVNMFGAQANIMKMAEVKSSFAKLNQIPAKLNTEIKKYKDTGRRISGLDMKSVTGFAKGGKPTGTDTVPAMLTPGEFVMKKSAAQGVGYSNLHRMNQSNGVNGYAAGGIVTGTRGNYGVPAGGGGASMGTIPGIESASKGFTKLAQQIGALVGQLMQAGETITLGSKSSAQMLFDGAKLLGGELSATGNAFIKLPTMVQESIMLGAENFTVAITDASKGISTVDNILKEAINSSVTQFKAAITDASKGISTVDNIMKSAMTAAMSPLKPAMSALDVELKKFGRELKTKLVYFDILKKANTELVAVMEKLGVALMEKADDFNILKAPLMQVEASLVALSAVIMQQDQLFIPLRSAVWKLSQSMQGQATQVSKGGGGGMQTLSGPMKQLMTGMLKSSKALMTLPTFVGQLNGAMVRMVEALNNAATNITKTGGASLGPSAELKKLEARIVELEGKIKKLEAAASGAAGKLNQTKTPMAGGAGGGGMSNMANQAMMAAMMIGMMVTQMGNFDKATEKAINASVMLGAIFGMLLLEVGNAINSQIAKVVAARAATQADIEKAGAARGAAAASMGVTIAMMGLAVMISLITFWYVKATEAAKEMAEEINKAIMDLASGEGNIDEAGVRGKIEASLKAEAVAREGLAGALIGIAVTAVILIAAVALTALTLGGAAIAFAVLGTAAAAAGWELGASSATVSEKLLEMAQALGAGAVQAAGFLNDRKQSQKRIEVMGLEDEEKLDQEVKSGGFSQAAGEAAMLAGTFNDSSMDTMSPEERAEVRASDTHTQALEAQIEMQQRATKAGYEDAATVRASVISMSSKLIEGGKTAAEALNDPKIKASISQMRNNIRTAALASELNTASTIAEAKARTGLVGKAEDDMTRQERIALRAAKKDIAEKKASAQAGEASDRLKKQIVDETAARKRAEKEEQNTLMANKALAREANAAAVALNSFTVGLIGMNQSFKSVDMELASLTGSVKEYKNANAQLIGTLESGNVTSESAAAARETGAQFGIGNEVNALIRKMEETERIRLVLLEKGQEDLTGGLEETAANLQLDKFLNANAIDFSGVSAEVRNKIMDMLRDGLQPDEIEKITELLNGENKKRIKVLQELAKVQAQYLSSLFKFGGAIIKAQNEYASSLKFLTGVQLKGAKRMAKAEGRELSVREVRGAGVRERGAGMGAAGLVGAGVQGTVLQLNHVTKKLRLAEKNVNHLIKIGADDEAIIKLQNEQKNLQNQTKMLTANLKKLADQADLAAAIMGEIDKEKGKRDTIKGLISEFTFASNQGRRDMDRNFMALQRVMQTGNLNSIPDEMRSAVGGLLSTLENIAIGPQGQTGGQIKKMLEIQMANQLKFRATGQGLTGEEMERIFNKTTKEEQLINDLRALHLVEQAAAQALANQEAGEMQNLIVALDRLVKTLQDAKIQIGQAAAPVVAQPVAGPMRGGLIQGFAEGGTASSAAGTSATGTPAEGSSTNAVTYKSSGKNMFQPRGTDTVPAMLTPGEFVMQKSAVDNIGVATLSAMNKGEKPIYRQVGGPVTSFGNYINDPRPNEGNISGVAEKIRTDMQAGSQKANADPVTMPKTHVEQYLGTGTPPGWPEELEIDAQGLRAFNFSGLPKGLGYGNKVDFDWANKMYTDGYLGDSGAYSTLNAVGSIPDGSRSLDKTKSFIQLFELLISETHGGGVYKKPLIKKIGLYDQKPESAWGDDYTGSNNIVGRMVDAGNEEEADEMLSLVGPDLWLLDVARRVITKQIWQAREKIKGFRDNYTSPTESFWGGGAGFTKNYLSGVRIANDTAPLQVQGFAPKTLPFREDWAKGPDGPGGVDDILKGTIGAVYNPLLDTDYPRYANKGFSADFGGAYAPMHTTLPAMVKNYRASVLSSYDHNIEGAFGVGGWRRDALSEFYKTFITKPDDAQPMLTNIIATLAAIGGQGIDVGTGNAPFMDFSMMPILHDAASESIGMGDSYPPAAQNAAVSGTGLNYVPWDTETYPAVKHNLSAAKQAESVAGIQNILKARQTLLGLNAGSTPDMVAGSLDVATGLLRGAGIKSSFGNTLWQEIKANNPVAGPVEEVKDINVEEIAGGMDSPFITDATKTAAIERAQASQLKWKVPEYAKRVEKAAPDFVGDKMVIKGNQKSIQNVDANAETFDALFPYFAELGNQVRQLIGLGAIVGMDEDGISINQQALSLGVKAAVPPPMMAGPNGGPDIVDRALIWEGLAIPNTVDGILPRLDWWSNRVPEKWTDDDVSRDEKMLMHKFFGMGNVEHVLAAMQADARIALTKLAMTDFNTFTGADIFKKVLPNSHLTEGGNLHNLQDLEKFKAGLVQRRADREKPVARASGGPIDWSPRGTDTVPAMLTPGEFVMKKSAVDKYGMGFMSAINGGKAPTVSGGYMATGGSVSQFGPPSGSADMSGIAKDNKKSSLKLIAGQSSLLGAQNQTIAGVGKVELGVGNIGEELLNQESVAIGFRNHVLSGLNDVYPNSFATGGPVGINWQPKGTDTIPAMLTPGEFVMKKSAVDKYGTGFMSAINNGVQRFATGGPVQYLKNGTKGTATGSGTGLFAGIGDIVSSISDSLSAFTTAFGLFSGLSDMLSRTINDMASMTITHKIKVHGTLHIPGFSQSAINNIVNTIANEVVDGVDEKIQQAFDKRDRKNDKRT